MKKGDIVKFNREVDPGDTDADQWVRGFSIDDRHYVVFDRKAVATAVTNAGLRKEMQRRAKELGLPATGKTEEIANLLGIAEKSPATWSRADFEAIAPHLSIHQDLGEDSNRRVEIIMREGLDRGMVDSVYNWINGQWTWAKGKLKGGDAYLFITMKLKFRSKDSPWLAEGNIPLYHFRTREGQDLYDAITQQP